MNNKKPLLEEDPENEQKEDEEAEIGYGAQARAQAEKYDLKQAAHPRACIFTWLFKAAAIASYLFLGLIFNTVFITIIVILLSAVDFWVVKNITGRLLVGLRWWSDILEDGTEKWIFESHDKQFNPNAVDSLFFWTGQVAASGTWAFFLVLNVLSFTPYWAIVNTVCLCLCGINLWGFYKCRGEHNKKLNDMRNMFQNEAMKIVGKQMINQAFNNKK